MKITVLDILEAHQRCDEFDMVVSVVDHPAQFWDSIPNHKNHVVEFFHDELDASHKRAPQRGHIQRILDKTASLPDDANILVHCYAGQCRSTAMAIAIATQHGADPVEAAQDLFANHHCTVFWPNSLILKHASEILNNPRLLTDVLKWMSQLDTSDWY